MPSKSTTPTTASKLGQYSSEHPDSAELLECVLKKQVYLFIDMIVLLKKDLSNAVELTFYRHNKVKLL